MAQYQTAVDSVYGIVDPGTQPSKPGVALGEPSLATTATVGFAWLPTCAGTPTGVPATPPAGMSAFVYDTTGKAVWTYDQVASAWKRVLANASYVRPAQQTNATVVLATYTPAADASVEVSCNVNVTTGTTMSMSVTVTYTDENNAGQTLTFPLVKVGTEVFLLNGLIITTGVYSGMPFPLRVKAATAISMQTAGAVTACVYTAEGAIKQIA
jgi:hypothetical protein